MSETAHLPETARRLNGRFAGSVPPTLEPMMLTLLRVTYAAVFKTVCDLSGVDHRRASARLMYGSKLTLDPAWRAASDARAISIYLINTIANVPQALIARAVGVDKATVLRALSRVEDRRDLPLVDALVTAAESIMERH